MKIDSENDNSPYNVENIISNEIGSPFWSVTGNTKDDNSSSSKTNSKSNAAGALHVVLSPSQISHSSNCEIPKHWPAQSINEHSSEPRQSNSKLSPSHIPHSSILKSLILTLKQSGSGSKLLLTQFSGVQLISQSTTSQNAEFSPAPNVSKSKSK